MSPGFVTKLNRILWTGLLIAAAVTVAAYGLLLITVRHKERDVEQRWASTFGPMQEFASRFPEVKKNEAAARIESIVAPLGLPIIPLNTYGDLQRFAPGEWGAISGSCHHYLEAEFDRLDAVIEPMPPEISAFLNRHGDAASSVRNILINEGPAIWNFSLHGSGERPPNQVGIISIGEWLCLDALSCISNGDHSGCLQDLEATWSLEQGIRSRPELVFFGTAVVLAKDRLGVLIKSGMAPPQWADRLKVEPYRKELQASLQFEAWRYWTAGRMAADAAYTGRAARGEGWIWKTFGRLWFRLSMADADAACLDQIEILEKEGWCSSSMAADADKAARDLPKWGAIGKFGVTRMSPSWISIQQLGLELEFARKLFVARDARSSSGKWPAEIPAIEKSDCPGTRWNYSVNAMGVMTLAYSGFAARPKRAGRIDLPLIIRDGQLSGCAQTSQAPMALRRPS